MKVAVVTFDNDYFARYYVASTGLAWPLLVDAERTLYRGYGMLQASFWDIWGLPTWVAAVKALLRGTKPQRPGRDIYQRGGDVLIDPAGIVRFHHVGRGPANRPAVETLLAAVGE